MFFDYYFCYFLFMLTLNLIVNFSNLYVFFTGYMFVPLNFIFSTEEFLLQIFRTKNK